LAKILVDQNETINESKSEHVTFTTRIATFSAVYLSETQILQTNDDAKFFGISTKN